jgi:hypothetical protein
MPTFNEIIVTKKTDIAWDGGKATENLIPNDGDLVFDSTGGGRSAHQAPLLDELGWATDNNRDTGGSFDEDAGLSGGSLAVLLAFGEPVTFTATVSPNSPPASPEPVTHAGGHFELVLDGHSSSHLSLYDLIV